MIRLDIRYTKQLLDYRPIGRRRLGRPLKRLLDGCNCEAESSIFISLTSLAAAGAAEEEELN